VTCNNIICLAPTHTQEASEAVRTAILRIAGVEANLARASDVEAQIKIAADLSASNRVDLGNMAESLGSAFQQVNKTGCAVLPLPQEIRERSFSAGID